MQLNSSKDNLQKLESPGQPNVPRRRYREEVDCAEHGKYIRREENEDGVVYMLSLDCPHCLEAKKSKIIHSGSNTPLRYSEANFSNFELTCQAQQDVWAVCQDYANDFAKHRKEGRNLILTGEKGTGKNHLSVSIFKQLQADNYSVLRIKASDYLDLYWSKGFEERMPWLLAMVQVDLLMIDEVGRSSTTPASINAFFRLIDGRYEAVRPTLITTNLIREKLIEALGEETCDRLRQDGSIMLSLDWPSHRR